MAGSFVSGRFDDSLGGRLGRFRHRFTVGTDERNKRGTYPLRSIASTKLISYHMWCGRMPYILVCDSPTYFDT
jgi:hypothetical protein